MDGELSPRELEEVIAETDPLVVDVRDDDAYGRRHIPGSEHVPFREIPDRAEDIADADRVVTVCYEGLASVKAARLIAAHREFDGTVESLAGGMEAWEGPVDSDDAGAIGDAGTATGDGPDAPF